MAIIQVLLQKEALIFRNSYLRTRKQILIAFALLILGAAALVAMTRYLVSLIRLLLTDIPSELAMLVIAPFFYLILAYLLLVNFSLILQQARTKFYHSPELSLLITAPIPANALFVFHFILVTCFSKEALLNLPLVMSPLIALGAN